MRVVYRVCEVCPSLLTGLPYFVIKSSCTVKPSGSAMLKDELPRTTQGQVCSSSCTDVGHGCGYRDSAVRAQFCRSGQPCPAPEGLATCSWRYTHLCQRPELIMRLILGLPLFHVTDTSSRPSVMVWGAS